MTLAGKDLTVKISLLQALHFTGPSIDYLFSRLLANDELDILEISLFMQHEKFSFENKKIIVSEIDIESAKSFLCILAALNKALTQIKANGDYKKIVNHYFEN